MIPDRRSVSSLFSLDAIPSDEPYIALYKRAVSVMLAFIVCLCWWQSAWSETLPDLRPYKMPNWSEPVMISRTTGTVTCGSPYTAADTLYLSFAIANYSDMVASQIFSITISIDGTVSKAYSSSGLGAWSSAQASDISIGNLGVGSHAIKLSVDSTNTVSESNESNNEYTKIIKIVPEVTAAMHKVIKIQTGKGNILIWLYDRTPLHRNNFLKLATSGFYNNLVFHRVIDDFMIQGGDPQGTGSGGPGYTLPAEIDCGLTHVYGAVAAARLSDSVNPEKRSSGSQFYIVENKAGTHFLDNQYTVFGIVISGMEVVEDIADDPKDINDRPLTDIVMNKVEVLYFSAQELLDDYGFEIPDIIPAVRPELIILSPGRNGIYESGTIMHIEWDPKGTGGNVSLSLSRTGVNGSFETIVAETPNDGSYDWLVPGEYGNFAIRITPLSDISNFSVQGEFSVIPGLADAISMLKVLADLNAPDGDFHYPDADGNGKAEILDVIYVLQKIGRVRNAL